MERRGRILLAAMVAVVSVVAGCSGGDDDDGGSADGDRARTVQPGAPGEPSQELSRDEAASVTVPEHAPADTAFMQDMIVHHRQALAMTALVDDRTGRDDLPVLAERITETQEAEIAQIEAWLTDRGEEVPAEDADHEAHGAMPGMATAEQLEALEAAEGPAFDRQFLDLMIAHHQGALAMVTELRDAGGGLEPAADRFARDVDADQSIEITRMQDLLATLG